MTKSVGNASGFSEDQTAQRVRNRARNLLGRGLSALEPAPPSRRGYDSLQRISHAANITAASVRTRATLLSSKTRLSYGLKKSGARIRAANQPASITLSA